MCEQLTVLSLMQSLKSGAMRVIALDCAYFAAIAQGIVGY